MFRNISYIKVLVILLFISTLLIISISCDSTDPPIPPDETKPILTLALDDTSCTEAWLQLTTKDLELPAELTFKQYNPTGDSLSQIFMLNTQDSLLYIDSLLPNQNYFFQVSSNQYQVSSIKQQVTTMDTTSHNFTFETFTFGGNAGSCVLYEVAIINENNIWAVGDISIADTSQNGYTTYNAVHWDGTQWELKRIYYYGSCSAVEYPLLKTIWAFKENDIVITNGGSIGWFDGNTVNLDCRVNSLLTGAINKIWGSSSNDLYTVGNNGNITHYNGSTWSRIESGTDVNINDVFGINNQRTNQRRVFCAVSNIFNISDHKILIIDENNIVDSLYWDKDRRINSVWSDNGRIVYTSGGGIFSNKSGGWVEEVTIPLYYTNKIRGNGMNDIFVVGDFALFAHFNGMEWNVYQEFLQLPSTSFNSISVKGNIIAIAGYNGENALLIIGKRN